MSRMERAFQRKEKPVFIIFKVLSFGKILKIEDTSLKFQYSVHINVLGSGLGEN